MLVKLSLRRRTARAGLVSLAALIAASAGAPAFAQAQPDPAPSQTPPSPPPAQKPADGKDKKPAAKSTTVNGIVVTADQPPVRSDIDRRSYDLSKDLGAQNGSSIADSLRNVPSVDVDINGNVSLRGQSGVTIMVDGKPAPMYSGPGGGQALLQVPADQYERVEVMTNPSAAFSPDGSAGIINLISKKRHPMGSFGSVRVGVADADRYRGGANGSIKTDKLTVVLFAGGGQDNRPQTSSGTIENFDPTGALITSNDTHGITRIPSTFEYGSGNVTWDYDPKTQLSLGLNAFHFKGDADSNNESILTNGSGAVLEDIHQIQADSFGGPYVHGELKFRRDFAGDDHNLTVTLSHDRQDFTSAQALTEAFVTPADPDSFQASNEENINNTTQFSGDYVRPMPADGKLKAGWDIKQEDDNSITSGFLDASSPSAPNDPSQSDDFRFKRTISAGYLTYQQPFGKLTVLGGLRLEGESLDIDDITSNFEARSNDVKLYPTLHLSYAVTDSQQLLASYSERIDRPQASAFDPFVRVVGPFNETAGNPFLEPEQTKDFEGSWQYRGGGQFYIATVYYKLNTGGVTTVTSDVGDGVLLSSQENLTRSKDAGLELVASGKLGHGFSYNVSGNVYWNEIDGNALGFTETRSDTTVAGRGSINWQADPKDFLQLNVMVRGRTLTPQGYTENKPMTFLGYQRKLTEKLKFTVTVQDLFDTAGTKTVYDSPLLRGQSVNEQHDRAVFFGLSFAFGATPRGRQQPDFDFGDQPGPPH